MTAPQIYSVQGEKDRIIEAQQEEQPNFQQEHEAEEEKQPESLREQIDAVVLDLHGLSGSLETVGELMLYADVKCDSSAIGVIITHYTELLSVGLNRIEDFLTDDMRRDDDEACI